MISWEKGSGLPPKTWRPLGRGQDAESKFSKSGFIPHPLRIFLKDSAHCLYPFQIEDTPAVNTKGTMIRILVPVWRRQNAEITQFASATLPTLVRALVDASRIRTHFTSLKRRGRKEEGEIPVRWSERQTYGKHVNDVDPSCFIPEWYT